jgi:cell division protein FtsN
MRLRDPRNASLLILATDTVVIALIVIVIASLGVGFLIGYKISDWTKEGIPFLSASQTKAPLIESTKPADHEKKPEETVAVPAAQGTVKDAAGAPADSAPKEQPAQSEDKTLKPPASAEQESVREGPARAAKAPDTASSPQATQPKQSKPELGKDAKQKKPAREVASAQKTPRDSGAAADSRESAGSGSARVYTIQIGAFPQKDEAEQLRDRVAAKGFKAYIVNEGEQDPYYRVRVGKFRDRKSSEQAALSLREKTGADYYILATKP